MLEKAKATQWVAFAFIYVVYQPTAHLIIKYAKRPPVRRKGFAL